MSLFTGIIGAAACIGWMFYRVHTGVITFGTLSVLAYLAFQVGGATKTLLSLIPTVMEYMASAERLKKLLSLNDEEEEVPSRSEKKNDGKVDEDFFELIDSMYKERTDD